MIHNCNNLKYSAYVYINIREYINTKLANNVEKNLYSLWTGL